MRWAVCFTLVASVVTGQAAAASDGLTDREKACGRHFERVEALIRAGKMDEASTLKNKSEECLAHMKVQQQARTAKMADDYDDLVRKARQTSNYTGPKTFLISCEEAIKLTLKSPSTYKRISATELPPEPISADTFLAKYNEPTRFKGALEAAGNSPVRLRALVSFDSANAFGTPVRLSRECTYDAASVSDVPGELAVKLNGRSGLESMSKGLAEGRR